MICTASEKFRCRDAMQRFKQQNPHWQYGWKSKRGIYRATVKTEAGAFEAYGHTLYAALMRAQLKTIQQQELLYQPTNEFNQAIG